MTDAELIAAEHDARVMCHNCPVYTGEQPYLAQISGQRSAALGREWMTLRSELKARGLTPKEAQK